MSAAATQSEQHAPDAPETAFSSVIGESLAIRTAIALACRVAVHPSVSVLIQGETGTGKELFARGIHYGGPNASDPFVAINCAAIPEQLLESELFGHERGSFTNATARKLGLLEVAAAGSVFLDEVTELPLQLQAKLLRALETQSIRRVGGLTEHPIRCRIISAGNANLHAAVSAGRFREDLYYRLNVFRLELPALRARDGDIERLARHFVAVSCREKGLPPKRLSPETEALLRLHNWPGNVRELKNAIERAVVLAEADVILPIHLTLQSRVTVAAESAVTDKPLAGSIPVPVSGLSLADAEAQLVGITLRLTGGNHSRAARLLQISRPTLLRKIKLYGLKQS